MHSQKLAARLHAEPGRPLGGTLLLPPPRRNLAPSKQEVQQAWAAWTAPGGRGSVLVPPRALGAGQADPVVGHRRLIRDLLAPARSRGPPGREGRRGFSHQGKLIGKATKRGLYRASKTSLGLRCTAEQVSQRCHCSGAQQGHSRGILVLPLPVSAHAPRVHPGLAGVAGNHALAVVVARAAAAVDQPVLNAACGGSGGGGGSRRAEVGRRMGERGGKVAQSHRASPRAPGAHSAACSLTHMQQQGEQQQQQQQQQEQARSY